MIVSKVYLVCTMLIHFYLPVNALVSIKPGHFLRAERSRYKQERVFFDDYLRSNIKQFKNKQIAKSIVDKNDNTNNEVRKMINFMKAKNDISMGAQSGERIVEGYPGDRSELPSYVVVFRNKSNSIISHCGGNLITQQHVLTAAHCVVDYLKQRLHFDQFVVAQASRVFTRIGSTNLNTGGDIIGTEKVCVHPEHSNDDIRATIKDVSVLTMKKKVILSDQVQVASIHPYLYDVEVEEKIVGKKCIVAGWGTTSDQSKLPERLFKTNVTIISPNTCRHYHPYAVNPNMDICALDNTTDTCIGDTGSGLFCDNKLVAVFSWGIDCAKGLPGIYSRIDNLESFILSATRSSSTFSSQPKFFVFTLSLIRYFK